MNLAGNTEPANWAIVGPGMGLMILAAVIVFGLGWYKAILDIKNADDDFTAAIMTCLTVLALLITGGILLGIGNAG